MSTLTNLESLTVSQSSDYERGRQAAKMHIENGEGNLAKETSHLAEIMGAFWTAGYTEYYTAWEVLNRI